MSLWVLTLICSTAATLAMASLAVRHWRGPGAAPAAAAWLLSAVSALGGLVRPRRQDDIDALRARLARAGLRDREALERFVVVRGLSAALGLLIALVLVIAADDLMGGLEVGGVILVAGLWGPSRLLAARARGRQRTIAKSLPGAIDLLVTCLDAGLGLEQALARVAEELGHEDPILAGELQVVVDEVAAGIPVADAMRRLGKRVALEELETLCAVVGQASELGARMNQTLRECAASARRRRMAELDERAGRIGATLTVPLALCLLPATLLVMMGPAIILVLRSIAGAQ
jgi:tight adherence protein C